MGALGRGGGGFGAAVLGWCFVIVRVFSSDIFGVILLSVGDVLGYRIVLPLVLVVLLEHYLISRIICFYIYIYNREK